MNKKNIDHVVFIGNKRVDYLPIKIKLRELILDELTQLSEDLERKKILIEIQSVLTEDKLSETIDQKRGAEFLVSPQEWHWLAKHKQNKWLEYIIYRYQFKIFPEKYKLLESPLYLLIEPTSICNLTCPMCFQSDKTFRKKEFMGMMDWSLFTNLVDQAKEMNCRAVTLASRGEPLLHKDFGRMLDYLNNASILDVKINTNATKLTEQMSHDILSSNVSEVVFSLDAATKKIYEEIRQGAKFEEVLDNIRQFQKIREKCYPDSPAITRVSGVKVRDDQNIAEISKFWSEIVDEVTIQSAIHRWDTYNNKIINLKESCRLLWKQMYVWYDGMVNPCDFDYKSYLSVGNAYKNSLKEIWLGGAYDKLRQDHLKNRRGKHVPCDRCPLS